MIKAKDFMPPFATFLHALLPKKEDKVLFSRNASALPDPAHGMFDWVFDDVVVEEVEVVVCAVVLGVAGK